MFGILNNLTKAAVAIAVAPVALVADVVTLPVSASEMGTGPFDRTARRLEQASRALDEALKPSRDSE